MKHQKNKTLALSKSRAFTLIELLVVITIIGLLATTIIVFYDNAQANGRDTKRIADLSTIADAGMLLYADTKSFEIDGAGYNGNGQGWFNCSTGGSYPTSINQGFITAKYLPGIIKDTAGPEDGCSGNSYMYYFDFSSPKPAKLSVYAKLEKPKQSDETLNLGATGPYCTGVDCMKKTYGVNQVVTVMP